MSIVPQSFVRRIAYRFRYVPFWLWTIPFAGLLLFLGLAAVWQVWVEDIHLHAGSPQQVVARVDPSDSNSPCIWVTYPSLLLVEQVDDIHSVLSIRLLPSPNSLNASVQSGNFQNGIMAMSIIQPSSQVLQSSQLTTAVVSSVFSLPAKKEAECLRSLAIYPASYFSLTQTSNLAYSLSLDVGTRIVVQDKDEVPLTGSFVLRSALQPTESITLLLKQTGVSWFGDSETIVFTVGVIDEYLNEVPLPSISVEVPLETGFIAVQHFLGKISVSTTIAIWLALLPLLASGIFWLDKLYMDSNASRVQELKDGIDALGNPYDRDRDLALYLSNFSDMERKLDAFRISQNDSQLDSDIQSHFDLYVRQFDLQHLRCLIQIFSQMDGFDKAVQGLDSLDNMGIQCDIKSAIEWAIADSVLPQKEKLHARDILIATDHLIDYEFSKDYIEQLQWSTLVRSWPSISLWRRTPSRIRHRSRDFGPNAFLSQYAESDPFLFPPGQPNPNSIVLTTQPPRLRPEWYLELRGQVAGSQPVILAGEKGFGKTAAALLLAWDELQAKDGNVNQLSPTIPVYWQCDLNMEPNELVTHFGIAYAETLVGYLAATPYEFLRASSRQQSAMATLFGLCLGSVDELRSLFDRHRMRRTPMPPWFFDILREQIGKISPHRLNPKRYEIERLLQLIFDSCPHSVQRRLPIVDVKPFRGTSTDHILGEVLPTVLRRFSEIDMIGAVFLPKGLVSDFSLLHGISMPEWQPREIQQLMENRLAEVSETQQYDLSVFCDHRKVDSIEIIQNRVIEASHSLPGRMIGILQRFVHRVERTGTLLGQEEIDEILNIFEVEYTPISYSE